MPNENKKDFNAMLQNRKDMPKIQLVTDPKTIEKYGGDKMYFAPPIDYDRVMKAIPWGRVITAEKIRAHFAAQNHADFTDPMTAGIFINIAAWASHQRSEDETPYWRTLKAGGELNDKYPGGIQAQREKLESEGHRILQRGRSKLRYFVKDYELALYALPTDDCIEASENTENQALREALLRINRMEQQFDLLTNALQNAKDTLQAPSVQAAMQALSAYYAGGEWLRDYELDEQKLLPPELKRGVLSQDGLYELLSVANERQAKP